MCWGCGAYVPGESLSATRNLDRSRNGGEVAGVRVTWWFDAALRHRSTEALLVSSYRECTSLTTVTWLSSRARLPSGPLTVTASGATDTLG